MPRRSRQYVACEVCFQLCTPMLAHRPLTVSAFRSSPRVDRWLREFICWQHLIASLHSAINQKHWGILLFDTCAPASWDGLSQSSGFNWVALAMTVRPAFAHRSRLQRLLPPSNYNLTLKLRQNFSNNREWPTVYHNGMYVRHCLSCRMHNLR